MKARDLVAGGLAALLFAAAAVTGYLLVRGGTQVYADAPPHLAAWEPHLGWGTPLALAVAVLVVWLGPSLRLSWPRLLAVGYLTAVAWTFSLAMVDGWRRGYAERLLDRNEYLYEVPGIRDIPATLEGFTGRILDFQPDTWTVHVSAHPPGALLVFVWLDRIGLGGGAWAATVCVLVGGAAAVAVPLAVRWVAGDDAGRAAVPFVVLLPGAVWVGVSADGLFMGVASVGIALVAYGLTHGGGPRSALVAGLGGVVLGFAVHLSYGLVLLGPIVVAMAVATRRVVPLLFVAAGALAVVAVFVWYGFWWLDGYHLVVERYYQGLAAHRPYSYWVWANLAAVVASAGPVAFAVLARARPVPAFALPAGAAVAIIAADLSGLSKAETERIWLPFLVWLPAGAVLLPLRSHRFWLVVQASTALAVNHLLFTVW